jgi:hypothetical protein
MSEYEGNRLNDANASSFTRSSHQLGITARVHGAADYGVFDANLFGKSIWPLTHDL